MLLKDLKVKFPHGKVKTFTGLGGEKKRVFYIHPDDLFRSLSHEDWEKIKGWNGMCILPSKSGEPNPCFYFRWGWGGTPEYKEYIKIV